jgi:hypothetical protein
MNGSSEKTSHLQILQKKTAIRWQGDKKNHPPCDPDSSSGRGDACLTQAGFARHAGQTKKRELTFSGRSLFSVCLLLCGN